MSEAKTVLSKENISLALRMYAENNSPADIIKYFDDNKITHPTLGAIYAMTKSKCHQVEIEAYREEYYARIKDVPIAHKRTRLETRQELLDSLKKMFRKMLSKDGNIKMKQFKAFMTLVKRIDEVLVGSQDEMEKRPGTVIALTQNFGDRELSMEELLVEERNITGRIRELQTEGISLPDRTKLNNT